MRLRSASRWRPAEPQIRDFDRRSEYGHTSRFPATHPLGEKHPADYARHEVRGRGPIAARAGSGPGGAALCERTDACAALDHQPDRGTPASAARSEEHTSELQSLRHLVCRLLLEKKK